MSRVHRDRPVAGVWFLIAVLATSPILADTCEPIGWWTGGEIEVPPVLRGRVTWRVPVAYNVGTSWHSDCEVHWPDSTPLPWDFSVKTEAQSTMLSRNGAIPVMVYNSSPEPSEYCDPGSSPVPPTEFVEHSGEFDLEFLSIDGDLRLSLEREGLVDVGICFIGYPPCEVDEPIVTTRKRARDRVDVWIDFDFPATATHRKLTLSMVGRTNADGSSFPGEVLHTWENGDLAAAGPYFVTDLALPTDSRQVDLIASASFIDGTNDCKLGGTRVYAAIDSNRCDVTVADRISLVDGTVQFADADPIPPLLGQRLTRHYQSGDGHKGLFGVGWMSVFDQVLTQPRRRTSVLPEEIGAGAAYLSTLDHGRVSSKWPLGQDAPGRFSTDYVEKYGEYRAPGATLTSVFQNGFLVAFKDDVSGQEVVVSRTLDQNGVLIGITAEDSWNGRNWDLSIVDGLVQSITVMPEAVTFQYNYDGNGNLLSLQGPEHTWRSYEYGVDGVTAIRDGVAHTLETFQYANGRAVAYAGPNDEIQNIQYSMQMQSDSTTTVTRRSGSVTQVKLRPVGGALRVVERHGEYSTCGKRDEVAVFDERGNMLRQQDASGFVNEYEYDSSHLTRSRTDLRIGACNPVTDPNHCKVSPGVLEYATLAETDGTITTNHAFDDGWWPDRPTAVERASVRNPIDKRREFATYSNGNDGVDLRSVVGWTGYPSIVEEERTTTSTLYSAGEGPAFSSGLSLGEQPRLPKRVDGPRTDVNDVTEYVYYPTSHPEVAARGRLAATKNAAGHITTFENYDSFGTARRITDPNGVVTELLTDSIGRVTQTTIKGVSGCDGAADPLCDDDLVTTHVYDGYGPLLHEIRPGQGRTAYTYDPRGRVATISRGPSVGDLREQTEITYHPDSGKKSLERFLAFQDPSWVEKSRQEYEYDDEARLSRLIHADGSSRETTYDWAGRAVATRDENHEEANEFFTYDDAGRLRTATQMLGTEEISAAYEYDRHGNLKKVTDPNGNVLQFVHDDFGQVLLEDSPVSGMTTWKYNTAGLVTTEEDANGTVILHTYDVLGRTTLSQTIGQVDDEIVAWQYDQGAFGIGRLATMIDPTGSTRYAWERRGLLLRETKIIEPGEHDYATAFRYDRDGNRTRVTYPSGRVLDTEFDWAGRPTAASLDGTPIVTSASYLPFGPRTRIVFGNGTTREVTHDNRYRPSANALTGPAGVMAGYSYSYDPVGNVTGIDDLVDSDYDRTFEYDELHRLIVANGGAKLWGSGSYSYDDMGNLLTASLGSRLKTFSYQGTTSKLDAAVDNGFSRSVSYDYAGNETALGTRVYDWSPRKLLRAIDEATYAYDGRGIRTISSISEELLSLTLPAQVNGGQTVQGTVRLHDEAGSGGMVVTLSSSDPAVTVPASVTVPSGETESAFAIGTPSISSAITSTISASRSAQTLLKSLTVLPPPELVSLMFDELTLKGGQSTTGTVSLDARALGSGITVDLTSSDAERLAVPPTVIVQDGEQEASFTATAPAPVALTTPVAVTALLDGEEAEATLSILPPAILSLSVDPDEIHSGQNATATVELESAAAEGTVITFSSSLEELQAPDPVTMAAGAVSANTTVVTESVLGTEAGVLSAHLDGTSANANVTLQEVTLSSFSLTPSPVLATGTAVATVTLTGPAPEGGVDIEFEEFETGLIAPFITVPEGETEVEFNIVASAGYAGETLEFHARHRSVIEGVTLEIQPIATELELWPCPWKSPTNDAYVGGVTLKMHVENVPLSAVTIEPPLVEAASEWTPAARQCPPTYDAETTPVSVPADVWLSAQHDSLGVASRIVLLPYTNALYLQDIGFRDAVVGGGVAYGRVWLSKAAPPGGLTIPLTGSRSGLATVPEIVTVPEGHVQAQFEVQTEPTEFKRGTVVRAFYGDQVREGVLTILPAEEARREVSSHAVLKEKASANAPSQSTDEPDSRLALSIAMRPVAESVIRTRHSLYAPELTLLSEWNVEGSTGTVVSEYISFGGEPVAQVDGVTGDIRWTFNDHLGAPILQTDAQSNITWRVEREPFGEVYVYRSGAHRRQPLALPGQEDEVGTEDSYNVFRWYRPGMGRFLSVDPTWASADLGKPQSWNRYSYVLNNPINLTDPDGKMPFLVNLLWELATDFVTDGSPTGASADQPPRSQAEFDQRVRQGRAVRSTVQPYDVGTVDELKAKSVPGDKIDIHHAPQAKPAGQVITNYDPAKAPGIAIPQGEHQKIPTQKGTHTGSPRDLVAKDIRDLRNHTKAPNSALQKLVKVIKETFPEAMKKIFF